MMKLENFVGMMTGHFDNKDQFDKMQEEGKTYPYAEHINTICNDKINNLPEDFKGIFVVEESYYEINGKRHASPHLYQSFPIIFWKYRKAWKLMGRELLDMMNQ